MRRLSVALIAAASTIAFSQIASAADLGRPVYKVPPPPPPVSDWSGVYVGGEGGYGWGHQKTDAAFPFQINPNNVTCTDPEGPQECEQSDRDALRDGLEIINNPASLTPGSIKQNGWLFGGFFGAQKQWGSWVLGIEGDIDGADIKGSAQSSASSSLGPGVEFEDFETSNKLILSHDLTMHTKIDMLASLRGKVGWSFAPNWLLYGTGGAAFAHVQDNITYTSSLAFFDDCPPDEQVCQHKFNGSNAFSASSGDSMFGWAAGAGVDWKLPLDAGSALVFGVEYLHYGFPEHTITLTDNAGSSLAFNAKESVDTVKGRISYLFSIH